MSAILLQRIEGVVIGILALAVVWYGFSEYGILLSVALFLLPDISMLGYLRNARIGSIVYNLGHTFAAPFALAAVGFVLSAPLPYLVALLWIAHIGIDRGFGFGFKMPSGFHATHLGQIRKIGKRY